MAKRVIKVLICGDRHWTDRKPIARIIAKLADVYGADRLLVITGGARGADTIAAQVARNHGIHVAEVEALWDVHHNPAGPIRNRMMLALRPHLVVAFHPDLSYSKGTADVIARARKVGVRVKHVRN